MEKKLACLKNDDIPNAFDENTSIDEYTNVLQSKKDGTFNSGEALEEINSLFWCCLAFTCKVTNLWSDGKRKMDSCSSCFKYHNCSRSSVSQYSIHEKGLSSIPHILVCLTDIFMLSTKCWKIEDLNLMMRGSILIY